MLETLSEGLAAAILIYDRNDLLVFASHSIQQFFPVPASAFSAGRRLRDFLGAVYDSGACFANGVPPDRTGGREGWLSAQIARHWKERSDNVERFGQDRWVRNVTRRLPTGYGICLIRDVSEETKRENQQRIDLERVQLTEDILDSLPFPISVKDRNLTYAAVNRAMCRLFRREPEDIIGRTDRDIQPPHVAAAFEASDRRVMDTGAPLHFTERVKDDAGDDALLFTQKWRVGKPGRSFLVTVTQDITDLAEAPASEGPAVVRNGGQPVRALNYQTLQALPGQRILLVTADGGLEARALRVLSRLGFDSCSVRNGRELSAFLDVARSSHVHIDLIVLDSDMDVACLELAERHGVETLALDGWQIANELAFSIARVLKPRDAEARKADPQELEAAHVVAGKPPVPEPPAPSLDVLVVEDNDINRIVFSQILDGLGYSHVIATSGEEALRLWQEHAPRIVLLDTTLPDMPGGEVARRIRRQETVDGGRVPIVGVLARATDGDRETCLLDGMDEVMMKPISPDMLEGVIRRFFVEGMTGVAL
ncbi:response regulator [Rhizobiaceae bacterium BDR2-2]|uniref:Response regulator n=1 Tax=Ectorhizobium quercum TaxID=2965071 RepID=A0AAE3N2C3_9HYPH|nr:response regulator [Ectorhizobium quercum]MCX8996309.1 response regulator [Ectorhizobium quercum]MCX8998652.1 response regulator [Ectorhizobium quercum]